MFNNYCRLRKVGEKTDRMAFMGAAVASVADQDGWRNILAGLKSPHGPDEDK